VPFGTSFFVYDMLVAPAPGRARWQGLSLVLLVAAVLLYSHPFTGIRHDGTLYAGEALARLLPDQFRDDIYFRYGSQGRFTLFPTLYALLIATFGVGGGTIVGLLVASASYLASAWYLIAFVAPPRWRVICLLSVILGWTLYGGVRVFAYSEPFLTARSFAEPAVLVALGLLARRRLVAAGVALLVGLAMHPLIAAAGVLIAWVVLVQQDRRWLLLGVGAAAAVAVIGLTGRGPFADLFDRYDATWLALLQEANPQAFVTSWSVFDYGIVVFDVVVLWFASRFVDVARRRLIVAAMLVGVGTIVMSLLLVDFALNPFFGKLQIWRAEWVMQWLAMASLPIVLATLWQRAEHGRLAALFLGVGWMAPHSLVPAVLGMMAIAIDHLGPRVPLSKTTVRLVAAVVIMTALTITVQHEVRVWTFGIQQNLDWRLIASGAVSFNLVLLAVALVFIRLLPRLGKGSVLVALVLLCGASALWDQRPAWTRTLESYTPGRPVWAGLIEPDEKVYWYRDLIAPWVLLGHGNYYTPQQGSGAVFSRDMTIEFERRRRLTTVLELQEQVCRLMNNLSEKLSACEPDKQAFSEVCREGGIDYLVLQSRLEGVAPIGDLDTMTIENGYEKKFFLYRCSTLKSG